MFLGKFFVHNRGHTATIPNAFMTTDIDLSVAAHKGIDGVAPVPTSPAGSFNGYRHSSILAAY